MRRPMVAGNWKMHGSRAANRALLAELERSLKPGLADRRRGLPAVCLFERRGTHAGGRTDSTWARRMCAPSPAARSPAQVAAAMLKDVGCSYVIVGHSERRRLYHEDDALVARKFAAALEAGPDAGAVRRGDLGGARGAAHRGGGRAAARCGHRHERRAGSRGGHSSPTSRSGRSARDARPRRSRRRRCILTCAAGLPRKMLNIGESCAHSVRRQRQGRERGGAVLDARRGRRFGGRRLVERR